MLNHVIDIRFVCVIGFFFCYIYLDPPRKKFFAMSMSTCEDVIYILA
jgi:hypothetical protein